MSGQSRKTQTARLGGASTASVDALATRALSLVAQRNAKPTSYFDDDLAERLHDASIDHQSNRVPDVLQSMLDSGIPAETIACVYIPHVARQLGDEWCADTLSFARVTIGTARLQSSLRTLGPDWVSHSYAEDANPNAPLVAVIARDPFHTLGALVLCGQLRRMGVSVRLTMGATTAELGRIFLSSDFGAVLISASESESLDSLKECVNVVRKSSSTCPPIIVGGGVLDEVDDVCALSGADFATKDPVEALEYCGLTRNKRSETLQTERRS